MRARAAKKILRHLQVMHLGPGDVLVFRLDQPTRMLRAEQVGYVKDALNACFPGRKVLIVGNDVSFAAIEGGA